MPELSEGTAKTPPGRRETGYPEESREKLETFSVITPEQIADWTKRLREDHAIDLSEIPITSVQPGDDTFDFHELIDKLRGRFPDEIIEQKVEGLGYREVSLDALRAVAEHEHVKLDGRLRGFTLTTDGKEIIFFAIRDDEAIAKAEQYAEKRGDAGKTFKDAEGAKEYLRGLGEWAFHHEVGHVVYARLRQANRALWQTWNTYVAGEKDLQEAVLRVQHDKWAHGAPPGHIQDEAFAEMFPEVISRGRLKSRLGNHDEAVRRLGEILERVGIENV